MDNKMQLYTDIASRTVKEVTAHIRTWERFLQTAAWQYKYAFPDQLLIYAQRPDAVACAPIELWNETFRRYVRRGSKGIALIDDTSPRPRLRYVFDVSDTVPMYQNAREVYQWELRQEHKRTVLDTLSATYDGVGTSLRESIHNIANQMAKEYYVDNAKDISYQLENSYLEEIESYGAVWTETLSNSIAYMVMSRCGLQPEEYFEEEDFRWIADYNTKEAVYALGGAVSDLSKQMLLDIGAIVKKYEKTKYVERSTTHGNELSASRGLSDTQHHGSAAQPDRQPNTGTLRNDAQSIPERKQTGGIQQNASNRDALSPPNRNQPESRPTPSTADGEAASDRGTAEQRNTAAGMGERHGDAASPSRGNSPERNRIHHGISQTLPLSTEEFDTILRDGGNLGNSFYRIAAFFSKGKSPEEEAAFLQNEYISPSRSQSGNGYHFSDKSISVWFCAQGMFISQGKSALRGQDKALITWEEAAERIRTLYRSGEYTNAETLYDALENEKLEAATNIWALYHDAIGKLPEELIGNVSGYNNIIQALVKQLDKPDTYEALLHTMRQNIEQNAPALQKRRYLKPQETLKAMERIPLPTVPFTYVEKQHPTYTKFITDDEIEEIVTRGGAMSGKNRILSYFLYHKDPKERVRFLISEYGTGGSSMGPSGAVHSYNSHSPSKGITLGKGKPPNEDTVVLPWSKVERLTDQLIREGRYLTMEERKALPQYEKLVLAESIQRIHLTLDTDDHNPFPKELRLSYPGKEEWEAIKAFFNSPEQVNKEIQTLKRIAEHTSEHDKSYALRKSIYSHLAAYPKGKYTLFPGLDALPTIPFTALPQNDANNNKETNEEKKEDERKHKGKSKETGSNVISNDDNRDTESPPATFTQMKLNLFPSEDAQRKQIQDKWEEENQRVDKGIYTADPSKTPVSSDSELNADKQILSSGERESESQHQISATSEDKSQQQIPATSEAENQQKIPATSETESQQQTPVTSETESQQQIPETNEAENQFQLPTVDESSEVEKSDEFTSTAPPSAQPPIHPKNYRITTPDLGEGGSKTKFRHNIQAIQALKSIESNHRPATPEEQDILVRYVGWGGLPQAFDDKNPQWQKEYQELLSTLTPEEYASARKTTLDAHYTTPQIIRSIYETVERLGFSTGNILEPSCGIGHFFGLLPSSMEKSKLYGVELDDISARIASLLYPKADIRSQGFEQTDFPDAFFDLAIGNVPFGSYTVADKRYDSANFPIHDYFLAKSLDLVRPGGILAFVTSKGTMDKRNPQTRRYLAQRAQLLGAVRLPNTAFLKNAGTSVTSDILFFQKRDRKIDIEPEWLHLGMTADNIPINSYFAENPHMLLGTMSYSSRMYGNEKDTTCLPFENTELEHSLRNALSYIQGNYREAEPVEIEEYEGEAIPAIPGVKNFSYTLAPSPSGEETVYFRENSLMVPADRPAATLERIKGMLRIRDHVQALITLQLDDASTEQAINAMQDKLNTQYDSFTAAYGLLSSQPNSLAFREDSSYYLLCSLEILDDDGNFVRKADMFSKRTIRKQKAATHADTSTEALAISIGEKARPDMTYMSQLTGKENAQIAEELRGVLFMDFTSDDPSAGYVYRTADDFLSGNVREKLARYRRMREQCPATSPHYQAISDNVSALESVQPKDLEAGEISLRLGATWIDPLYVEQFMYETFQTVWYMRKSYQVKYSPINSEWRILGKARATYSDIAATVTYGTKRKNAYEILDDSLNLRDTRVYDNVEDADGHTHRVLNKKETTLAQQKQEAIKKAFEDWVWKDPGRRQAITRTYNERFNAIRNRTYDGSHILFHGMSPLISLRKHQLDASARIIYGGNTLLAHEVGAGKTFEMIAAAMEMKRLGICHKSLFAVPNHLTEQWATEFLRLYPAANILVATKKEFEMRHRKKFCAKIATGEYDAVIIGHSQLEKIPMSKERQERMLREQIEEIALGIEELEAAKGERYSIKQLEKTKRGLETRLKKLIEGVVRDDVVTFEQLGVDRLFVDEAHNFKNLFLYTKMRNVAGLSTSEAQKSSDLFLKCRYMDELTGNRGIIFATGTPISNSIVEMYTMQRYLQYQTLEENGLTHFDAWASVFGETATQVELAPEGTGYRARTRFSQFHNLPELMTMFREVVDIQTADMLHLPVPKVNYQTIVSEASDIQQEMVQELSKRAAAVHSGSVEPEVDNMLRITSDGRKIGLDQRLMNPLLPDDESSKVNTCVKNVLRIWKETQSDRLTQLIFSDISTPNKDGHFNVYDDIREKLTAKGIPPEEIAFIHEADTETKKKELFAKVRSGKVRILLGSTMKMGAGTNIQDLLVASHDLDCPWRPADLAQRAGRIVRQFNQNPEVWIYRYVTNGTFDSFLWQTVETKQRYIAQIMTSKSPVRSCSDMDETSLSYAEIKALCAGNPKIMEKMNLDVEVAKLRLLKSDHQSQHYRLEDAVIKDFPERIGLAKERIAAMERDIANLRDDQMQITDTNSGKGDTPAKFSGMVIDEVTYTDKEAAGKAFLDMVRSEKGRSGKCFGSYRGFQMKMQDMLASNYLTLTMNASYTVEIGSDTFGNITRMNHVIDEIPSRLNGAKEHLDTLYQQLEAAKLELQKPFTQERELQEKESRLFLLNQELDIDGYSEPEEPKAEKKSIIIGLEKYQAERDATGTYHNRPQREGSR